MATKKTRKGAGHPAKRSRSRSGHPEHRGKIAIKVGDYEIYAAGTRDLRPEDYEGFDLVIPLEPDFRCFLGQEVNIMWCPWRDMSEPPKGFEDMLPERVIPALSAGKKILVYCIGSHGRTGTFIASLIALLEPETPDPIAAVRERHCAKSVETLSQADFVFWLRDEDLPEMYADEFTRTHRPGAFQQIIASHGSGSAGSASGGSNDDDAAYLRRLADMDGGECSLNVTAITDDAADLPDGQG